MLVRDRSEAREKIAATIDLVGVDANSMSRYTHEFFDGQRQRIGIARVMILAPRLVIADEPVSTLDVSIQVQVLNLLKVFKRDGGVSMLIFSRHLCAVRRISERAAVMFRGELVETGKTRQIFETTLYVYTRRLLVLIPRNEGGVA